jgi:hypothetical protein
MTAAGVREDMRRRGSRALESDPLSFSAPIKEGLRQPESAELDDADVCGYASVYRQDPGNFFFQFLGLDMLNSG